MSLQRGPRLRTQPRLVRERQVRPPRGPPQLVPIERVVAPQVRDVDQQLPLADQVIVYREDGAAAHGIFRRPEHRDTVHRGEVVQPRQTDELVAQSRHAAVEDHQRPLVGEADRLVPRALQPSEVPLVVYVGRRIFGLGFGNGTADGPFGGDGDGIVVGAVREGKGRASSEEEEGAADARGEQERQPQAQPPPPEDAAVDAVGLSSAYFYLLFHLALPSSARSDATAGGAWGWG
mmetsp:Transcript_40734/g.86779  ORF Transcript_40734/g.86779 Transcript_40734/m.86779 type:complete len:234 (+) Transcript_40734:536-1237(+)